MGEQLELKLEEQVEEINIEKRTISLPDKILLSSAGLLMAVCAYVIPHNIWGGIVMQEAQEQRRVGNTEAGCNLAEEVFEEYQTRLLGPGMNTIVYFGPRTQSNIFIRRNCGDLYAIPK